jgi:hypothetical protein
MAEYKPRHARHADPRELPPILRGVADLITVIESNQEES